MNNKKRKSKWYCYILGFVVFIGLIIFVDYKLEGVVCAYFERNILFDRETILLGGGEWTRGTLNWGRLKDSLINIAIWGFLIIEVSVIVTSKIVKSKERKETINEIEDRIKSLSKGESVKESEEFTVIDTRIKEILKDNEETKEKLLLETDRKNNLVTYLAHDLKTPLTIIIGYLTILNESEVPEHVRKDYIKKLLEKSYRLEDLTNQFFDITRFNLQDIPLNKTLIDGNFFLEQLTEEFYPLLKEKNLNLQMDISENLKIYGDGSLLARVTNNLLKNAIAYSSRDSIIKITGKIYDYNTSIIIENDGDVISEEELKIIFEKFYRRDQSRSQSAGAGLGLAIAREIVEKHQGDLIAESNNGHTVFTVTLPNSL